MGQGESPETEVGGCVGDGTQTVLNGVDGLVDEHLTEFKLNKAFPDDTHCGK